MLMANSKVLSQKDELLDYYENLLSLLLQRIKTITNTYDDDKKGELVASIALDFANANKDDIENAPDVALQFIRCKKSGIPNDYDAGRYSADEAGFNFVTYCYDLSEVIGYTEANAAHSPIAEKANLLLSKQYDEKGWTPVLWRIQNDKKD